MLVGTSMLAVQGYTRVMSACSSPRRTGQHKPSSSDPAAYGGVEGNTEPMAVGDEGVQRSAAGPAQSGRGHAGTAAPSPAGPHAPATPAAGATVLSAGPSQTPGCAERAQHQHGRGAAGPTSTYIGVPHTRGSPDASPGRTPTLAVRTPREQVPANGGPLGLVGSDHWGRFNPDNPSNQGLDQDTTKPHIAASSDVATAQPVNSRGRRSARRRGRARQPADWQQALAAEFGTSPDEFKILKSARCHAGTATTVTARHQHSSQEDLMLAFIACCRSHARERSGTHAQCANTRAGIDDTPPDLTRRGQPDPAADSTAAIGPLVNVSGGHGQLVPAGAGTALPTPQLQAGGGSGSQKRDQPPEPM